MSDTGNTETLTGFDLWTPNDYSNFITISAAAIGSTLLVIFKSRCKNITLCWGLIGCIRDVKDDTDEEEDAEQPPQLPQPQAGDVAIVPNNP
tara:strand:- start:152 stop:427 length:276 start_codon:yes stop_codon:yes gene_type:complete